MEKFIGIVKKETRTAIGVQTRLLTRFEDTKEKLDEWIKIYPGVESIVLDNTAELDQFFRDFEDYTPMTEEEKAKAKAAYDNLFKD